MRSMLVKKEISGWFHHFNVHTNLRHGNKKNRLWQADLLRDSHAAAISSVSWFWFGNNHNKLQTEPGKMNDLSENDVKSILLY